MIGPDATGRDFLGRVSMLLDSTDPLIILAGIAVLVLLCFLAIFNRRFELFIILVSATVLSGAVWTVVDTGSTLLRWFVLILLALLAFRLRANPGISLSLYIATIVLGLIMTIFSHDFMWSAQNGILMLATTVAILVVTDDLDSRAKIRRLFTAMMIPSLLWTILGLVFLPDLLSGKMDFGYGRYAGYLGEGAAATFSYIGSLLVPFACWAMFQRNRVWFRCFCGLTLAAMMILLIVSTQRTGTFSAVIGCLPFLLRRRVVGLAFLGGVAVVIALALVQIADYNPDQAEFASERFANTSTTGRYEIWIASLDECLKSPFTGYGFGSDRWLHEGHRPHNWYLSTWYATGVFGVVITLLLMSISSLRALKTAWFATDLEMSDFGSLVLGQLLARLAAGFFATFSSPSNLGTVVLVLVLVLADRLPRMMEQEQRSQAAWWNYYRAWQGWPATWRTAKG